MGGQPGTDALWSAVDVLVDRAATIDDLRSHRIDLFAARRWRQLGRNVPPELVQRERAAGALALTVPTLLSRIRDSYDGPAILHKGPEVAARYPDPALRAFGDIDLLVPNAEHAQQALLAGGFELTGDPELYIDIHHLRPLRWRELPLVVEIHSRPKWIESSHPPRVDDLLGVAVTSRVDDRFLALQAPEHALLLAAHSWAHEPLRRIRDLLDIAAILRGVDHSTVAAVARRWGVSRLWMSTYEALEFIFGRGVKPLSVKTWARNLPQARERTVLENHLERLLSDFWVLGPTHAAASLPKTLVDELRPARGETWAEKVGRTRRALKNARRRRSEHRDELVRTSRRD